MAVLHFFTSKFHSNIYSILFDCNQYSYCIPVDTVIVLQSILLFYYNTIYTVGVLQSIIILLLRQYISIYNINRDGHRLCELKHFSQK